MSFANCGIKNTLNFSVMPKVFFDTDILPKAYRKLEPSLKVSWMYLWTRCDKSGVWDIDLDLFEFDNGFELDFEKVKKSFVGMVEISKDKILLKDWIRVNYPTLKEDYNPHKPVFRDIHKNDLKLAPSLNQASFKLVDEEEDVSVEECKDEEESLKGGVGEILNEEFKLEFEAPVKVKKDVYKEIVDVYHMVCVDLAKVQTISDERKRKIDILIKKFGLEKIGDVFRSIPESDFLNGRVPGKLFKANFDWILNQTNFLKILEGNFKNIIQNGTQPKSTAEQFTEAIQSEAARKFTFSK